MLKPPAIFAGRANVKLTQEICTYVGVPLGNLKSMQFSDGEIHIEIQENVRGVNCFVVQPTCNPGNEHLMELLIVIDALKRASAGQIVAVIPYFGYARQDRKVKPRTSITSRLVADLITAAGANRVLSVDLHAGQIQGFFNLPFDHLYSMPIFMDYLTQRFKENVVVVSPDTGGVERARAYSKRLGGSVALVDKRRPEPNISEVMHIVGQVQGLPCLIVDDMIDTAGTLVNAATALMEAGATSVHACATHAVFSGEAIKRIDASPLEEIIVSDTIPQTEQSQQCSKIRVQPIGQLLGEAIRRIHHGDSISSLFI